MQGVATGRGTRWHWRAVLLAAAVNVAGCGDMVWQRERGAKMDWGVAESAAGTGSAATRDTIGSLAYYDSLGSLEVGGYGLVIGLGKDGSTDCSKAVFDQLVEEMYKEHEAFHGGVLPKGLSPERLIRDEDTAVVVVRGRVPPAATPGTRFTVSVRALPGTQTRSLRGGRLLPMSLKVHRSTATGKVLTGRTMAKAMGPLFLNPFSGDGTAISENALEGVVLSGGVTVEARPIRLVLSSPSYLAARRVQDRINARLGGGARVASAASPSYIELRVPEEFKGDEGHFLALVRGLYLTTDPAFVQTRARELGEELVRPGVDHARIAIAFEGMGRDALPVLRDLYAHERDVVSFHAAAAGLRLGDHLACDAMSRHAENAASEHRYPAIRALSETGELAAAGITLRRLLYDGDVRVQVAAYEALAARNDPAVSSKMIGGDNLALAQVPGSATRFVYVRRTGDREIALFGDDLRVVPPFLYRSPDGALTMHAQAGDEKVTLLRMVPATGSVAPPVQSSPRLRELVELLGGDAEVTLQGEVVGLGMDYSALIRALYHLSRTQALNGEFVLEQPNLSELMGPKGEGGRPESEL